MPHDRPVPYVVLPFLQLWRSHIRSEMTSGISTTTDNLPENLSRVYKSCDEMKRPLRSVYLDHASGWPDCATTQPRGRRLRPRRHILLTISPTTAASHLSTLNRSACAICRTSNTSRACHENALDPLLWLFYASFSANPTARSSFASLLAAKSLPTQYSLIPKPISISTVHQKSRHFPINFCRRHVQSRPVSDIFDRSGGHLQPASDYDGT
jgi:hypothetical protein